MAKIDAFLG